MSNNGEKSKATTRTALLILLRLMVFDLFLCVCVSIGAEEKVQGWGLLRFYRESKGQCFRLACLLAWGLGIDTQSKLAEDGYLENICSDRTTLIVLFNEPLGRSRTCLMV